jgi:TolB-like protein
MVEPSAGQLVADEKKQKKKDKLRSAWISFLGRIVAQVVGAVATIVLGLAVVQKYQGAAAPPAPLEAVPAPRGPVARTATPGERALAVLPLENFSPDKGQEYFADGMTEALIANLAQVKGLRVISRTSAMRYKGQRKPLPEIARELNVDLIVEGSVFREADRVRVTAQLIDAHTDEHLWARSYDRRLRDVLALQSDVATAISREIDSALAVPARSTERAVVDPAAYDAYLKGRQTMAVRTMDALGTSIDYFQPAVTLNPRYAEAHAGIADAYALLGTLGYGNLPAREAMPRAKAAAERLYEWDWAGAEQSYRRALELQPGSASTLQRYTMFLSSQDRSQRPNCSAMLPLSPFKRSSSSSEPAITR